MNKCKTLTYKNWINRERFTAPATSKVQINILQPWIIVKRASCHLRLVSGSISDKIANNLKLWWRKNSFIYVLEGVCMRFQFGIWLIAFNCLYEIPRNEIHWGCYFIAVIWQKENFISGDKNVMQTLSRNKIIWKKISAHANIKKTQYSNCCCGIETTIKSLLCHRNKTYIQTFNWI